MSQVSVPMPNGAGCLPAEMQRKPAQWFWLWVMCLLGVDYFSTLAYQPTITFEVAGLLGPPATVFIVLVTLLGVLPVYYYVAGRSSDGLGSIALLERVVHGWRGKTLVLILLGFAATDFVMLKTISLADAAVHVIHNEYGPWQELLDRLAVWGNATGRELIGEQDFFDKQLVVTLLLGLVAFVFWFLLRKGFNRNVILLAVPLVGLYLLLNAIVIGSALLTLLHHPDVWNNWTDQLHHGEWQTAHAFDGRFGWGTLAVLCLLFFPQLALGLSGFELSLILMPQVKGKTQDPAAEHRLRVRNTRKVLITAAAIMSVYLLGAVLVTTLLIPPHAQREGGPAAFRALAYLAHGGTLTVDAPLGPWFGVVFGTLYDLVTILLLVLAGTSVMTALAVLLPQFLLRFGMELRWVHRWGLLLIVFAAINLIVTLWFRASVSAQRGAYATGVLVLITCACVVTLLDKRRLRDRQGAGNAGPRSGLVRPYYVITALFVITTIIVILRSPSGLLIAAGFIGAILAMSIVSRYLRADELRTIGFDFKDAHSKFLWDSLRLADFPVLVPHRPGRFERDQKEQEIRRHHNLDPQVEIAFLEIELQDPSDFYQNLQVEVFQEGYRFVIRVGGCVSVAHAIAAVGLEMSRASKPPALHFGWSDLDLLAASWSYLAFGEGNVPWKVRELLARAEPDIDKRPRVIVG